MTEVVNPLTKAECVTWIAALRSGAYVQGHGELRRETSEGTKFCCLGVLNDLSEQKSAGHGLLYIFEDPDDLQSTQPFLMLDNDVQTELYKLNDNERFTFEQIADYIEKHILPTLKDD